MVEDSLHVVSAVLVLSHISSPVLHFQKLVDVEGLSTVVEVLAVGLESGTAYRFTISFVAIILSKYCYFEADFQRHCSSEHQ